MSKLLVVVGATGFQGSSVVKWFQHNEPSWRIRGLTRNTSSNAATDLAKIGVEIVEADLGDLASLKAAFKGANYIYAYTHFWGVLQSDAVMGRFRRGEIKAPVGAESLKIELQQGKNIADAAAEASTLERLVWAAMPNATKGSKGKYTQVFHFDSKAAVTEYMLGLKALEGKVSMLHLGVFTDNIAKNLKLFQLRFEEDKTAIWQTAFPGDLSMPWVDIEHDLGAFVKGLIDAPAPTQVLVASEWLTPKEWLELWSAAVGVKSRFEESNSGAAPEDDPTGIQLGFVQTGKFLQEFGYTGNDPDVLMPEELQKKGVSIQRTKIADYMAREDWSKVLP